MTTVTFSEFDNAMMELALSEARAAADLGDVPVGAVLICEGKIVARAKNESNYRQDPTAHAEMLAIRRAADKLGTWHLDDCTLYVSLEPCPMCAGAILNSHIGRVVFACRQAKTGAVVSACQLFLLDLGPKPLVEEGLLAEDSSRLLRDFFQERRLEKKQVGGPAARKLAALEAWQERRQQSTDPEAKV
ncbi:MAG: nucleoside deaminase [Eubacteriales bacterium]|nr:nucleoside deaminase [Eubacteriales bacterium]